MKSSSVIALDQPARVVQPRVGNRTLPRPSAARPRMDSIDLLRGLIMVLMVLDHTRDFFGSSAMNPRDVHDPALFLTRWVTHFCAPLFIFLAGLSAFLYGTRGRTRQEVSFFLFTRGAWLVLLELTVVLFGWTFNPAFNFFVLQVIWAIGWSMIALSGLIYLPRIALAAFALAMIGGHNLLDGIKAEQLQSFGSLWLLVHESGFLQPLPGIKVLALYPLVPWIGVMAAGYVCGPGPEFSRTATAVLARWRGHFSGGHLCGAACPERLRRSGAMAVLPVVERERPLLHKLRKVPAFTPLPSDDARCRAHRPGAL